jgi:ribosomal protein S14
MYLILTDRCAECGDELDKSYIREFGLFCPICLRESANLIQEEGGVSGRKDSCN